MAKLILKLSPVQSSKPSLMMSARQVHLGEVPDDCQVYLFYFSGYEKNEELESALLNWGQIAGKNLFVGFWGMDDERYPILSQSLMLGSLPAIVVTGKSTLASIKVNGNDKTAFERIDSHELLTNTKRMMDCLERSYNLFIRGSVIEALNLAKKANKVAKIEKYLGELKDWLGRSIGDFLKDHNVKINILNGLFSFESSSAPGGKET